MDRPPSTAHRVGSLRCRQCESARVRCRLLAAAVVLGLLLAVPAGAAAQAFGEPDREAPGDAMIQAYLAREAERVSEQFAEDIASRESWEQRREQLREEYLHMLGLWPLPERTPLEATVTGTLEGDGYVVELLHYQSMPGLYVTANLYRPADAADGERLPAVLYVCGHSPRGRDGNKAAFQSYGIWFARHGYVCLVLDTLQMGEIAAVHHGTYNQQRWWWHSRGYTPAGVECWNGVRGIDYLVGRPDVDPERIAVTGISGGGAATFWIAAADERVAAAVPVSGMADLPSYVSNRVINGHCDCMFLYNAFQWPWVRIAALFAPRPLLLVNSDNDPIFPMDANERLINRLERVYSLYGAGDRVSAVVSIGGHDYRQDIREAANRFINLWLRDDPRPVTNTEIDLVTGNRDDQHPIAPSRLRVFPTDADLPRDQRNTSIDEHFVPLAQLEVPEPEAFDDWKAERMDELRRVTFRGFPETIPAASRAEPLVPGSPAAADTTWLETEAGITIRIRPLERLGAEAGGDDEAAQPDEARVVLVLASSDLDELELSDALRRRLRASDRVFLCEPRGIGATRWTRRNPPNYVQRAHALLGMTVDRGRIWDAVAAARYLQAEHASGARLVVAAEGAAAVWAVYAGLLDAGIDELILEQPQLTHMDSDAPQLLNVLRVLDVPDAMGMLAPRRLVVLGAAPVESLDKVRAIYQSADAADRLQLAEK